MEKSISKETKTKILKSLIRFNNELLGAFGDHGEIIGFLEMIWDLYALPSTDARFTNAKDDVWQHMVNNNDWDFEELFFNRFKPIEDDHIFNKLLEVVVSPAVRGDRSNIEKFVNVINPFLKNENVELIITDYTNSVPVYTLEVKSKKRSPRPGSVAKNDIKFYLFDSNLIEKYKNCIVLEPDYWNDYGIRTLFEATYIDNDGKSYSLGNLKIMKRDAYTTKDVMPKEFLELPEDYCSLGRNEKFYLNAQKYFGSKLKSVLLAIRDCAFYPTILAEFENDNIFTTSLTRDDDAKRMVERIRVSLSNLSAWDYFNFTYKFNPPFSSEALDISFDFKKDYENNYTERLFALIGENGTGKTQILSSLANELSLNTPNVFSPRKPLFDKIMTVSYSYFDRFKIPLSNPEFNYAYCGLRNVNEGLLTQLELVARFRTSTFNIVKDNKVQIWKDVLEPMLGNEFTDRVFLFQGRKLTFSQIEFDKLFSTLSSGQSILLFVLTEIIKNITKNSLILLDEPETHLHPNIISNLMRVLIEILKEYESYCIVATHSPVVIRELYARNVYVLTREGNSYSIDKINRETFGESVSKITEEVFGNTDGYKNYIDVIRSYVDEGADYKSILEKVRSEEIPVGLETRLMIKSIIASNEKS